MALTAIIFLIPIIWTSTSGYFTQVGRYEELQKLGNPCYPKDTCQSLKEIADDHLSHNRSCECGEHCVTYQTCCIDSNYLGMERFVPKHPELACQKVQTRDYMVYMVSTCLQEWQKSYFHEKCVHAETQLRDPMSEVPVTSIASMITYRNVFCAICNNDVDSADIWNIGVKPMNNLNSANEAIMTSDDIIDRMEYNALQNSWGINYVDPQTKKWQFQKIQIKFYEKENLKKFVKPCHPRIISQCNPAYKSTRLRFKCQAYYSPVRGRRQGTKRFFNYRNIHCALCNGLKANVDEFACLIIDNRKRSPSLSFTKLLDINMNEGDVVGKTSRCKEGQMYDTFFKKCRSLGCGMPNFVIKNGACVKSD